MARFMAFCFLTYQWRLQPLSIIIDGLRPAAGLMRRKAKEFNQAQQQQTLLIVHRLCFHWKWNKHHHQHQIGLILYWFLSTNIYYKSGCDFWHLLRPKLSVQSHPHQWLFKYFSGFFRSQWYFSRFRVFRIIFPNFEYFSGFLKYFSKFFRIFQKKLP